MFSQLKKKKRTCEKYFLLYLWEQHGIHLQLVENAGQKQHKTNALWNQKAKGYSSYS